MKIPVQASAHLVGVADPTNVLEADTIHVSFGEPFVDAATGERICHLDGRDVLITRFPLQLPSDIYKVRVVHDPRLAYLGDCIVFPTRGHFSIPAKLQGGDLDGDLYYLFWDSRLVEPFENQASFKPRRNLEYFGVTKDERLVKDVLNGENAFQDFLREGFRARLNRVPLGQTSNLLLRVAYQLWPYPYRHPAVWDLAELYTLLIDADKQGHVFDLAKLDEFLRQRFQKSYVQFKHGISRMEYEKFISERLKAGLKSHTYARKHPNDVIFFNHVRPSMIKILDIVAEFVQENSQNYMPELKALCENAHARAEAQARIRNGDAKADGRLQNELKVLAMKLMKLKKNWAQDHKLSEDRSRNQAITDHYRSLYKAILPQDPTLPETSTMQRLPAEPSSWELLKASATYSIFHRDSNQAFIYQLAAPELAYMKVNQAHHARIVPGIYHEMTMRKEKIKKDTSGGEADAFERAREAHSNRLSVTDSADSSDRQHRLDTDTMNIDIDSEAFYTQA